MTVCALRQLALWSAALVTLLLVQASGAAADEIYRWVDERGRVHFSSTPPAGGSAQAERWQEPRRDRIHIVPAQPQTPTSRSHRPRVAPPVSTLPASPAVPAAIGGRSRARWREIAQGHESRIETLERQIEGLEDSLSFPSRYRSSMAAARHEARQRQRIEDLEARIAAARAQLEELEDEARRQDVPPGWLR